MGFSDDGPGGALRDRKAHGDPTLSSVLDPVPCDPLSVTGGDRPQTAQTLLTFPPRSLLPVIVPPDVVSSVPTGEKLTDDETNAPVPAPKGACGA